MTGVTARDEVLARIRTALGRSRRRAQPPRLTGATRLPDRRGDLDAGCAARPARRAAGDYRATVRRCTPGGSSTGRGRRALAARGAAPRSSCRPAWPRRWPTCAASRSSPTTACPPPTLDGVDGVVTGAAVAIAETGTIVLDGSAGQGRRAITLVPDYHLCVVRADQVVGLVPEALARLDPHPPADLDQRAVRDQRHRAEPGRGRARPAHPRRHPGQLTIRVS